MNRPRQLLEVMGIVSMFAMTIVLYLVWSLAFLEGGSITVHIDRYGEELLELLVWTFVIPLVSIGLYGSLRRIGTAVEGGDFERAGGDTERGE